MYVKFNKKKKLMQLRGIYQQFFFGMIFKNFFSTEKSGI